MKRRILAVLLAVFMIAVSVISFSGCSFNKSNSQKFKDADKKFDAELFEYFFGEFPKSNFDKWETPDFIIDGDLEKLSVSGQDILSGNSCGASLKYKFSDDGIYVDGEISATDNIPFDVYIQNDMRTYIQLPEVSEDVYLFVDFLKELGASESDSLKNFKDLLAETEELVYDYITDDNVVVGKQSVEIGDKTYKNAEKITFAIGGDSVNNLIKDYADMLGFGDLDDIQDIDEDAYFEFTYYTSGKNTVKFEMEMEIEDVDFHFDLAVVNEKNSGIISGSFGAEDDGEKLFEAEITGEQTLSKKSQDGELVINMIPQDDGAGEVSVTYKYGRSIDKNKVDSDCSLDFKYIDSGIETKVSVPFTVGYEYGDDFIEAVLDIDTNIASSVDLKGSLTMRYEKSDDEFIMPDFDEKTVIDVMADDFDDNEDAAKFIEDLMEAYPDLASMLVFPSENDDKSGYYLSNDMQDVFLYSDGTGSVITGYDISLSDGSINIDSIGTIEYDPELYDQTLIIDGKEFSMMKIDEDYWIYNDDYSMEIDIYTDEEYAELSLSFTYEFNEDITSITTLYDYDGSAITLDCSMTDDQFTIGNVVYTWSYMTDDEYFNDMNFSDYSDIFDSFDA